MSTLPFADCSAQHAGFAAVYAENFPLLRKIARRRFNVPAGAADDVVHDVFLSYLMVRHTVRDPRPWLVAGVCNASRRFWLVQDRRREDSLVSLPTPDADLDAFLDVLSVRQVVARLHPRCHRTLELHYFQGISARELAAQLGTTERYAEKLIHDCLSKAWESWHHLWKRS